jgi:toluene monooxygenase system protein E
MKPPSPVAPRARYKTYSHLAGERRIPDEYAIATSRLLYYPGRGFEVATPLARFYQQHQEGTSLRVRDWEGFADPRRLTYTRYTALMSEREAFLDRLLAPLESNDYDARLSAPALAVWEQWVTFRYPLHGVQMATAYVGQMAPAGRIVICCALQAADELRRIQRIAYRLALLRRRDASCGELSKRRWQEDPAWQPLRQLIEELLVTYDWGEAFTALCLCVKPALDELVNGVLGDAAAEAGDYVARQLFDSFSDDADGQAHWCLALVQHALSDTSDNREVLRRLAARWRERVARALAPLAPAAGARLAAALQRRLAPLQLDGEAP